MPYHLETEFKLRATQPIEIAHVDAVVREAGFACDAIDSSRHLDTYLDDDRGSLAAAGIGLRLREDRRGRRLSCKRHSRRRGALFVREETEAAWLAEGLPTSSDNLPHPLRDLIEPFVLQRALRPKLHLEIERDSRELRREEGPACELFIDRVITRSALRSEAFVEIEIEVHEDLASCEQLAARLSQTLPLVAAQDDKPTHASHLLGLPCAESAEAEFTPELSAARAITQSLRRHVHAMQDAETDVRSEEGPEALHRMRVALRRLRSLVRAFRDLWTAETAQRLLEQLAALAHRLGRKRDQDVMLAELPDAIAALPEPLREAAQTILADLNDRQQAERTALHTWLRSPERLQSTENLLSALLSPMADSPLGSQPITTAAGPRLLEAARLVRRLAKNLPEDLPIAQLHQLRIAGKRLRYLAEEIQHLPGMASKKAIAQLTKLQHSLGTVCDHEVAAERLLHWLHEPGITPPTAAALGGLGTRHHLAAHKARKGIRRELERFVRRKLWRKFVGEAE